MWNGGRAFPPGVTYVQLSQITIAKRAKVRSPGSGSQPYYHQAKVPAHIGKVALFCMNFPAYSWVGMFCVGQLYYRRSPIRSIRLVEFDMHQVRITPVPAPTCVLDPSSESTPRPLEDYARSPNRYTCMCRLVHPYHARRLLSFIPYTVCVSCTVHDTPWQEASASSILSPTWCPLLPGPRVHQWWEDALHLTTSQWPWTSQWGVACAGGGAEPVVAEEVKQSESAGACLPTISAQEDVFVV